MFAENNFNCTPHSSVYYNINYIPFHDSTISIPFYIIVEFPQTIIKDYLFPSSYEIWSNRQHFTSFVSLSRSPSPVSGSSGTTSSAFVSRASSFLPRPLTSDSLNTSRSSSISLDLDTSDPMPTSAKALTSDEASGESSLSRLVEPFCVDQLSVSTCFHLLVALCTHSLPNTTLLLDILSNLFG